MNDFDMMIRMYYEFGFSDEDIIEKVTKIFDGVIRAVNPEFEKNEEEEKNVDVIIRDLISRFGIPKSISGYIYLQDAIKYYMDHSNERGPKVAFSKGLYPDLAKLHQTKQSAIERCIRHAIELGCDRCGPEVLEELFGNTISWEKGKPTNSECISLFCEKVKLQLAQKKSVLELNPVQIMVQDYRSKGFSDHKILREIGKRYEEVTAAKEEETPQNSDFISNEEKTPIIANLEQFGVPKNIIGYHYLIDAIALYKGNPKRRLVGGIYNDIAAEYDSTTSKVERAIRHAIEVGCSRCSVENFQKYFGNMDSVPKAKEFVAAFAEKS